MTSGRRCLLRCVGLGLVVGGLTASSMAQTGPAGTALLVQNGRCYVRNTQTNAEHTILQSGAGNTARFSPDGRQIAVPCGDAIRLYRNDGASYRNLPTKPAPGPGDGMAWTTTGYVYWTGYMSSRFYRVNVQSGVVDSLPYVFGGGMHQLTYSTDGRRAVGYWDGNPDPGEWGTAKIDVFDLATGQARIIAAPCGPTISASGIIFAQTYVDHMSIHASIIDSMPTLTSSRSGDNREQYFVKTINFPHNITDPRWSSCSDDWMTGIGWNNDVITWTWVIDYKNSTVYDIGAAPATVYDFRPGALPDPGAATDPVLSVNPQALRFSAASTATVLPAQNVTVTNTGGGTLTKVTAAATAAWVVAAVQGSGGNTQTVANTVAMTGLAAGTYSATVTLSGGGAPNPVQYSVTLVIGTALPVPTAVSAQSSGGAQVRVAWQDNATDETGYAIERRPQVGAWTEVKRTAANVTSWTDSDLTDGATYWYRLRTVRGTEFSAYSDSVSVVVPNYPVIALISPSPGDRWVVGSTVFVKWTARNASSVGLKVSYDDGVDWQAMAPPGGVRGSIKPTDPDWGNCPFVVPDSVSNAAMVQAYAYDQPGFGAHAGPFTIVRPNAVRHGIIRSPDFATPAIMPAMGNRSAVVCYHVGPDMHGSVGLYRFDGTCIANLGFANAGGWHTVRIPAGLVTRGPVITYVRETVR